MRCVTALRLSDPATVNRLADGYYHAAYSAVSDGITVAGGVSRGVVTNRCPLRHNWRNSENYLVTP